MRRAFRRWLVVLLLLLTLPPVLLYLLANYWLESVGGRQALERELTRRAGLPVRLLGEFDIMLIPAIGVEGTELLIGGTGTDEELVRSGEYSLALALAPLLAGEIRVQTVRLADGSFRLDRLPPADKAAPGSPGAGLRLPSIDEFALSDFTIVASAEHAARFEVDELTFEGFEERRDTKFRLAIAGFGRVAGQLRWDPGLGVEPGRLLVRPLARRSGVQPAGRPGGGKRQLGGKVARASGVGRRGRGGRFRLCGARRGHSPACPRNCRREAVCSRRRLLAASRDACAAARTRRG